MLSKLSTHIKDPSVLRRAEFASIQGVCLLESFSLLQSDEQGTQEQLYC